MKTVNCYIGGRKSSVGIDGSSLVLFSHSQKWDDGTRFANMLGWKYARRFVVDGLPASLTEAVGYIASTLGGLAWCCAGSDEYAAIRAGVRRVAKHSRRGSSGAGSGVVVIPSGASESKPEPVVVPVVVEEKKPASAASAAIRHERFTDLLTVLAGGESAFLYGPAGSGKNHIVIDVAKELGLPFHYANSVQSVYELAGFIDAGGKYQETEFYRAFSGGGVFMLDEVDASDPSALITINAALANGFYAFPCGLVYQHKDFRCVAAGNTVGLGANEAYCGRTKIDEATRDRFSFIKIDYDSRVESLLAGGSLEILSFIRDVRASAASAGLPLVTGYRPISRLAKFVNKFKDSDLLDIFLFKGLPEDEKQIIYGGLVDKNNRFARAICAA